MVIGRLIRNNIVKLINSQCSESGSWGSIMTPKRLNHIGKGEEVPWLSGIAWRHFVFVRHNASGEIGGITVSIGTRCTLEKVCPLQVCGWHRGCGNMFSGARQHHELSFLMSFWSQRWIRAVSCLIVLLGQGRGLPVSWPAPISMPCWNRSTSVLGKCTFVYHAFSEC